MTAAAGDGGDTLRFILQIVGVFVGGSAVQLLIFLLKRRAEVRQLDTSSDVSLLGAAQAQVRQGTETEAALRKVIDDKDARIVSLERRLTVEQGDHARALDEAEQTTARLSAELARARTELSTLRFQIDQMSPPASARHQARDDPPP